MESGSWRAGMTHAQNANTKSISIMKHYFKQFSSEDVPACGIARSINRASGVEVITYRDVLKKASELGISFHTNKWGSSSFTAYQAERIRNELLKMVGIDSKYTNNLARVAKMAEAEQKPAAEPESEEKKVTEGILSQFTDKALADELRRRGWEFEAKRIEKL